MTTLNLLEICSSKMLFVPPLLQLFVQLVRVGAHCQHVLHVGSGPPPSTLTSCTHSCKSGGTNSITLCSYCWKTIQENQHNKLLQNPQLGLQPNQKCSAVPTTVVGAACSCKFIYALHATSTIAVGIAQHCLVGL